MIGIYYGSSTGNTEAAANDIAAALGVDAANIHNVSDTDASTVADYDTLLLGSSTWGAGDLQDDWYDFLDNLKGQDLAGKKVALFGCGDSDGYADTFCGALVQIYDALLDTGATFVGAYEPEGYQVTDSELNRDGKFLGLALDAADEENNPESRYVLNFSREDHIEHIEEIVSDLIELSLQFNGYYDGWGCNIITE